MPWTEIRHNSRNERYVVQHKGKKPKDMAQLEQPGPGLRGYEITEPAGAKAKDKRSDRQTEST